MQIHLWGQRNILGGGVHFGGFSTALKNFSGFGSLVNEVDPFSADASSASLTRPGDVNIFFVRPPKTSVIRGAIVKWGIFEADKIDKAYLEYLSESDLVWVPSKWAKRTLEAHGLDGSTIDVVPEGVDPSIFHPHMRGRISKDNQFRFYMCGKYEERKGYPELLEGFKRAFGNSSKVKLCLKSDNFHSDLVRGTSKNDELHQCLDALGLRNAQVISGQYSSADLALINSFVDAQVFSSRAEGWGLPLLEGLASGLPTICSYYSGQTEYLEAVKDQVRLLPYQLQKVSDLGAIGQGAQGSSWAVASPDDIATALLDVYSNYASWQSSGFSASRVVREKFSWSQAAETAIHSLQAKSILNPEWSLQL
jgi:glycosyltransferase involved in cell wall biosynthesis